MTMIEKLNALYGNRWYAMNAKHAALIEQYGNWEHNEEDCWSDVHAASMVQVPSRKQKNVTIRKVLMTTMETTKGVRVCVKINEG